ncbi:ArsR family transcriptional regulator [Nitrospirillum amazonense]|uniref:ArsR family transcriptional regulator n=1 Tax=Nitrospirillum amazonense TaxID=28077 RepID=A0A560JI56_9PROT|nr:helix-turn-helix transcriptional regulator [Nitrospirillum amazonense]TWB70878.1 ArsR family transcriptional regulator [Nitrospirillum amazonense]
MDVEAILKALANPVRRDILLWLKDPATHFGPQPDGYPVEKGVCVTRILEKTDLSQSTVSTYLAMLQRAGLLTSHRVGQWTFYRRDEALINEFMSTFGKQLCQMLVKRGDYQGGGG